MMRMAIFVLAVCVLSLHLWAQDTVPASAASPVGPPDSTSLVLIQRARPVYPISDEKDPLQGQVVIRITTSETGDVQSTEVVSGNPLLAAAAVNALKQWKFKPFIRSGKPVKASMNIPFNFVFRETADEPSATVSGGTGKNGADAMVTTVRVSPKLAQKMVLHKVEPKYPELAKTARIQGAVLLEAFIGKEGKVQYLHVVSGDPTLTKSAIDAVRQWEYKPLHSER